jgi:hypothetical protein
MIARLFILLAVLCAEPAVAQQNVQVPVEQGGRTIQLAAQLFKAAATGPAPAVAIFHGCGGPGQNTARMAGLLSSWGYGALVVDSLGARPQDVWPQLAHAGCRGARARHRCGPRLAWQAELCRSQAAAFMLPYGGGVALLRALSPRLDDRAPAIARAAILVAPDCALADPSGTQARRSPADPSPPWARSTTGRPFRNARR